MPPRKLRPETHRELELTDPSMWPFQVISSPADLYIAKGAALAYLTARKAFASQIAKRPVLETRIRTGNWIRDRTPIATRRTIFSLRHVVDPEITSEDVRGWLYQVHDALLRNVSPRRSTTLHVSLSIAPADYPGKAFIWTQPWW